MITIYGKYTNAIVYTTENEQYAMDDYARRQLQMICDHPSAAGSKIRVMPDVHPGKVGTIGLTMTVGDSLMPNLVGVDIGCGMTLARVKVKHLECQKLDTVIRDNVPIGGAVRKTCHKLSDRAALRRLRCYKAVEEAKAECSIGTLGGGSNSGSRHLGMEVTEYYLKEGQKASQMKKQGHAPYDLTCLEGDLLGDYLHDLEIVQEFARLNREAMVDEIVRGMKWKVLDSYTCIHNYIDFSGDVPLLRKGAISARAGEQVIIPMNMRDGIILGTGLGNADWNESAPHGSGRVYRRSEVKEHHTVSEFKKAMEGIYSICINKDTLDESPFAYRRIEDMLDVIGETVTVEKVIKPVYNFKAGGTK